MAAGTSPIFAASPNISWTGGVVTANTDTSMTSGTSYLLYTAGSNGSKLETVYINYLATQTQLTNLRFFVNNGSSTATTANNNLVYELSATTLTLSATAANTIYTWQANLYLKPSYRVYVTTASTLNGAGINCIAQGGDY